VCVVGGFYGSIEQWVSFETEWRAALGPRRGLHVSRLRWNTKHSRIEALLDRLGPIPSRHGLNYAAVSMLRQDYNDIVRDSVARRIASPYQACFQFCVLEVLSLYLAAANYTCMQSNSTNIKTSVGLLLEGW
jgi:hypothetical protein